MSVALVASQGGGLDKDEAVASDFGQWGVTRGDEGPAPAAPPVPTSCGAIEPGHGLSNGQAWRSCDGRFTLAMQDDGNLVLFSLGFLLWATGTNNSGAIVVIRYGPPEPTGNSLSSVVMDSRTTLLETPALKIELSSCELGPVPTQPSYTTRRQVLFPLAGLFRWHVGTTTALFDPNHVMFVETEEESYDSNPTSTQVTCLIATVAPSAAGRMWSSSTPFRIRIARASSVLQADYVWLAAALAVHPGIQPELWEERALQLLADATQEAGGALLATSSRAAHELARRAKDLFDDHGELLALTDLAELLDVSPAHLTDSFRRVEGVPIVRYQIQLRIMRALRELPHADDLSTLAIELGFASHSHFTTAFRARTGVTPSQFRSAARRGDDLERIRKRVRATSG